MVLSKFFQACWNIISQDLCAMVKDFFDGRILTKLFSHTCPVLIPKVESPTTFSQLRPMSLSNFSSKVISKIVSNRLINLLPKIISHNQIGFIKGSLITENIILTRKIIQNIKSKNKGEMWLSN